MSATHCQCNHNKMGHKKGYGTCFNCPCRSFRSEDELGCHPPVYARIHWDRAKLVCMGIVDRMGSQTLVWSCGHDHRSEGAADQCITRYMNKRAKEVAACTQANCLGG